MPTRASTSRPVHRLRRAGVIAALTGLALAATPVAANAVAPDAHVVKVAVTIDSDTSVAALPGARVELYPGEASVPVASADADSDGVATLTLAGEPSTTYVARATWPGRQGDLSSASEAVEFRFDSEAPVGLAFHGAYGVIAGTITALAGTGPVADLRGGTVAVSAGDTVVQRIPLDAAGSFRSGALPTGDAADYRVTFLPPAGYLLAEDQPAANPAFAMPHTDGTPTQLSLARSFSVTREGDTSTPTPTPTPSAPTTPAPTPAGVATLGSASTLSGGIAGSSEAQLDALLTSVKEAGPGANVVVTNDLGQVLGFAAAPAPRVAQAAQLFTSPVVQSIQPPAGSVISPSTVSLQTMDIETALMTVQANRAQLLDGQLQSQLESVQSRNQSIARFNDTLTALRLLAPLVQGTLPSSTGSGPAWDAARAQVRTAGVAAGITNPDVLGPVTKNQIDGAVVFVTSTLDSLGNSQQMDMLRLQSLSNKRNEAFDVMTNFVKKMQESRSSILANMRSTPTALGTVVWDRGTVTGRLDASAVQPGQHHLILDATDLGMTLVADVSVAPALAATGSASDTALVGLGAGLILLGAITITGAPALRRRATTTARD